MYRKMEDWSEIRIRVLVDGVNRRQILRETKMHWLTFKKILEPSEAAGLPATATPTLSPSGTKPARGERFKTGHSEVWDSYHFWFFNQGIFAAS